MQNWTYCWQENKDYAPKGAFPFVFRQTNTLYYGTYTVTKLYSEVITMVILGIAMVVVGIMLIIKGSNGDS